MTRKPTPKKADSKPRTRKERAMTYANALKMIEDGRYEIQRVVAQQRRHADER